MTIQAGIPINNNEIVQILLVMPQVQPNTELTLMVYNYHGQKAARQVI